MTKLFILVSIPFLFNSTGTSEKYLLERSTIEQARQLEATAGSKFLGFKSSKVAEGFFKRAHGNAEYPIAIYQRQKDDFDPAARIEYYYDPSDSLIFGIVQDWDIMREINFNSDQDKIEKQTKREKEYIEKYKAVKKELIDLLGKPSKEVEPKLEGKGIYGETTWTSNDKDVKLSVSFTPKLQEAGPFRVGTFRIRLRTDFLK